MRVLPLLLLSLLLVSCDEIVVPAAKRNKMLWPFEAASIWNTPIGSGARYVPTEIAPVDVSVLSPVFLFTTSSKDPIRPLVVPIDSPDRCGGTLVLDMIRVPDDLVLPPDVNASVGNSASFVQPDGHSLVEISGFARCVAGGPVTGFPFPDSDLLGDGRLGGQGGSGLSTLGGALIVGELLNGLPVRHALKVALSAQRYYFADVSRPESCFRWPADRCDGSFSDPGDFGYRGLDPEFTMGSLLAIPQDVNEASAALETEVGRSMFFTLQNYGAYVVGNAGVNWAMWGAREDAAAAFIDALGPQGLAAWSRDVNRLLPLLSVVANNGPNTIGGGGEPRQPLAPALAD